VLLPEGGVDLIRRVVAIFFVALAIFDAVAFSTLLLVLVVIIVVVVVVPAVFPGPRRVVVAVDRLGQEKPQLGRHGSGDVALPAQRRGDRVLGRGAAEDRERRAHHLADLVQNERLPVHDQPDPALAVGEHGDAVALE